MPARRRLLLYRTAAAVLGLAALVAGAVALFATDNGAGSLFLLTLGTVLVLLAAVGERVRLDSFGFLGATVKVQEVVRRRLELADVSSGPDGPDDARLRRQAQTLQKLAALYQLYEHTRAVEPVSDRRTATLDELADRMQAAALEAEFDPAEISIWFHEGTDALRVIALNVMLARPDCRDFTAVITAIDEPRSLFEQFYALRLAKRMVEGLEPLERRLLAQALERAVQRRRFRRDAPLMALRSSILASMDAGPPTA